ncbi:glycosyltransferase [Methylorubrum suomiense]|uniref:D-inositol-3-phosphate glycosyltransferase n=1 Tax=Methylorubrum suomiense TaxID=144191 RepID=A0ABQ4V3L5_9HYPH|nr:glycosyltransferase [Methylorubrum suomiense]GJE78599.1 D-inositol-3-phosphate glycosyltransferase [Methylorubrum suomiense]
MTPNDALGRTFKTFTKRTLNIGRTLTGKNGKLQPKLAELLSKDDALDPRFYRDFYPELQSLSDVELHRHYQETGRSEGRFANDIQAVARLRQDPALPAEFSVGDYLALNYDVRRAVRWQSSAILHYLRHGRAEGRGFSIPSDTAPKSHDPAILSKYAPTEDLAKLRAYADTHRGEMSSLPLNFSLVTYLAQNDDIRASIQHPHDGLKHYFNHGIRENRAFAPTYFSRHFVNEVYGIDASPTVPAELVLREIVSKHHFPVGHLVFLSEEELLLFYNITNVCYPIDLDRSYYSCNAADLFGRSATKSECLFHFCQSGQHQGLDISYRSRFVPDFYRREYLADWNHAGDPASEKHAVDRLRLFQDWLRSPREQNRAPNLEVAFESRFKFPIPPSMTSKLIAFRNVVPGLATGTLVDAASHLVECGNADIRLIPITSTAEADFFDAIAVNLAVGGHPEKADIVYHYLLRSFPTYWTAHLHLADQAHLRGDYLSSARIRKQVIDAGIANYANYRLLSDSLVQLEDNDGALDALRQAIEIYPSDVALRSKLRQAKSVVFDKLWQHAPYRAAMIGHAIVQEDLRRILQRGSAGLTGSRARRTIRRIAILGSYDLRQCRYYRIDQKVEQLRQAGYEVTAYNQGHETEAFVRNLVKTDLAIFFRVAAFPYIVDAIAQARQLGIPTVYDIDDLVFSAEHFPPSLASYAGQITAMQHAEIACGVPLFEHAMSLCEYGMVSTQPLGRHVEERVESGIAFVHPNALGKTRFEPGRSAIADDGVVTIFYGSGTKAHKQDFKDVIEPAIAKLAKKHKNKVRFILMGYINLSDNLKPFQNMIRVIEPVASFEDYSEHLSEADINLSVLSRSVFNDCKSEIKWLEAAAMGIPSVVSRTTTHEQVIEDGRTGFLCDTPEEFFQAIDRLVTDRNLREAVGAAARAKALDEYSCERQAENLKAVVGRIEARMPKSRKRLLIVNVFYPPQAIGGATRVVHDNVRDLKELLGDDWQIDVICTLEGGTQPYEITCYVEDGIRVFAITAADRPDIDHILEDPKMAESFETCFDIIQPTIVHFHCIQRLTTSIVDVPIKNQVPYLITMHDGWWISPLQFLLDEQDRVRLYNYNRVVPLDTNENVIPERARRLRRYLRSAAMITTVSKEFAQICRSAGIDDLRVVENGVSRLPKPVRVPRGSDDRVVLAHIGGASRHKGYHHVANLFQTQRFDNLSLLIVDHALNPDVTREEVWGNTPVTLLGKVPQRRIEELYGRIDVLLAPSVWPESYGLVTREALAAGCWVVASDRGAVGGCVTPGVNGMIVDVTSPAGLLAALRDIDADPARYRNFPDVTPDIRWASDQAVELIGIYEDILAGRSPRDQAA